MTVTEALRTAVARLATAGVATPALDARLLLAHAMAVDQATLLTRRDAAIDTGAFEALLQRRLMREPVALILGRAGFWSLDLEVSGATLIPRPESETLIEAAQATCTAVTRVLDLGTGTGCLLLAALSIFPGSWGVGVDRVPAAAALAARNAAATGLPGRIVCADWAAPIAGRFDLVLSNPPYIETAALPTLMPDVAQWEPPSALDGGPDGLHAYRHLVAILPRLLTPGGVAVLELGAGQAEAVSALAYAAGFQVTTRPDLAGIPRACILTLARYPVLRSSSTT